MNPGLLGLSIGFLIIVTLSLLVVIRTDLKWPAKTVIIFIACWFSIAMYYTPPNFMGWARQVSRFEDLPQDSIMREVQINEPGKSNQGGIYFWLVPLYFKVDDKLFPYLPKDAFSYYGEPQEPRFYRIPYDRELHKKLLEQKKKQQKSRGSMLIINPSQKGKSGVRGQPRRRDDKAQFKIVNPYELLRKD